MTAWLNMSMVGRSRGNCRETVTYMWGISPQWRLNVWSLLQHENSDYYVLHVGTNDLCLDRTPELIAKFIIDLALALKIESHNVSVSNIIERNDSDTLNK